MSTVVAIFDHMDALSRAQEALERAGFGDDVERVVDRSDTGDAERPAVVASPLAGGAGIDRAGGVAPLTLDSSLSHLDLPEEEAEFVAQSLQDGARLLVLKTKHAREVSEILEPTAQRVIASR